MHKGVTQNTVAVLVVVAAARADQRVRQAWCNCVCGGPRGPRGRILDVLQREVEVGAAEQAKYACHPRFASQVLLAQVEHHRVRHCRDQNNDHQGGREPLDSSLVEAKHRVASAGRPVAQERAADDEARDDEEDINTRETAGAPRLNAIGGHKEARPYDSAALVIHDDHEDG